MQLTEDLQLPAVEHSLAVELEWVFCTASQDSAKTACTANGVLEDAALCAEARGFWGSGVGHTPELLVLAAQAGVLFEEEPERLFAALADRQADPGELRLASETEGDRRLTLERLAALRRSSALRRRYVELLRRLWAQMQPEYAAIGAPAVGGALAHYRSRLAAGTPWRDFVPQPFAESVLAPLLERLGPSLPVVVTPTYFFGKLLVVELPDLLLVGAGAAAGPRPTGAHDALAKRLRALGHPTRLGILASLGERPASVGELAEEFGVAQPTVTNHVKLLREAGLLQGERNGSRLTLSVDPEALSGLAAEFSALTASGGAPSR
ncbi:MAG TPA: metalloregulator ArsR/SmtB family transcription factor [Acidimicrobiales bacterium]|nr:metalloregulator ArsR/SmtB family transcription factor [Acidimicrobiales bacterium]